MEETVGFMIRFTERHCIVRVQVSLIVDHIGKQEEDDNEKVSRSNTVAKNPSLV